MEKPGYWDDDKEYREVDICVDDESLARDVLSAKTTILVNEIPDDEASFDAEFGYLIGRGNENPRID